MPVTSVACLFEDGQTVHVPREKCTTVGDLKNAIEKRMGSSWVSLFADEEELHDRCKLPSTISSVAVIHHCRTRWAVQLAVPVAGSYTYKDKLWFVLEHAFHLHLNARKPICRPRYANMLWYEIAQQMEVFVRRAGPSTWFVELSAMILYRMFYTVHKESLFRLFFMDPCARISISHDGMSIRLIVDVPLVHSLRQQDCVFWRMVNYIFNNVSDTETPNASDRCWFGMARTSGGWKLLRDGVRQLLLRMPYVVHSQRDRHVREEIQQYLHDLYAVYNSPLRTAAYNFAEQLGSSGDDKQTVVDTVTRHRVASRDMHAHSIRKFVENHWSKRHKRQKKCHRTGS